MSKKPRQTAQHAPLLPVLLGTGFGAGFWPWGPGTAGAFVAAVVWFLLSLVISSFHLLVATLTLSIAFYFVGVWAADRLEPVWGEDPSRVVVDEMVGMWIALLAIPAGSIPYAVAAFVLFRLFDIFKPFGIRHMESMPHGVGVMMDDVLAGLYSFFVLYLFQSIILPLVS